MEISANKGKNAMRCKVLIAVCKQMLEA